MTLEAARMLVLAAEQLTRLPAPCLHAGCTERCMCKAGART